MLNKRVPILNNNLKANNINYIILNILNWIAIFLKYAK